MDKWIKNGKSLLILWVILLAFYGFRHPLLAIPVLLGGAYIIGSYFLIGYVIITKNKYLKVFIGLMAILYIIVIPSIIYFNLK
ncbi:MAG: hypothetical protein H0Z32_13115 [Bacillaceae bacterium]|nr:hypothetical protein [Bacillaceae bacterium]